MAAAVGVCAFTRTFENPVGPVAEPPLAVAPEPISPPAAKSPADAEEALGLTRGNWQEVQLGLKLKGFDVSASDGVVGKRTRQAVEAWQKSVGAADTGYLAAGQADRISGKVFTDTLKDRSPCPFCPEIVIVPAGSFMMGSAREEREWAVDQGDQEKSLRDEQPQHQVLIAADFALGRTEVTRSQFARFVEETNRDMSGECISRRGPHIWFGSRSWRSPGFDKSDNHPVVCVSWYDVAAYVEWIREQTGKDYRLPSEAEWEYAARAGAMTLRLWGDDKENRSACRFANVADRSFKAKLNIEPYFDCSDDFPFTSPVGKFEPNNFSLYDTLGNVWEWIDDCGNVSCKNAPHDASAWTTGDCRTRVLRGGSWDDEPDVSPLRQPRQGRAGLSGGQPRFPGGEGASPRTLTHSRADVAGRLAIIPIQGDKRDGINFERPIAVPRAPRP